jgi:hypothetical protein
MKKYRVWRQEIVMYNQEVEAKNKQEAYEKAFDLDFDDWYVGECDRYDSWKDSYIRKDLTEVIKESDSWSEGYNKWKKEKENNGNKK